MDKHFRFSAILLAISFSMLSFTTSISASERKINMNQHWKFYHGCIANAEQPSFNDSGWRVLDIPHDWSVEPLPVQREGITIGPFSRMSIGGPDTVEGILHRQCLSGCNPKLLACLQINIGCRLAMLHHVAADNFLKIRCDTRSVQMLHNLSLIHI